MAKSHNKSAPLAHDFTSSGTYGLSQVVESESKNDLLPDFGGNALVGDTRPFMTLVDDVLPLNATTTTAYACRECTSRQGHAQLGQDSLLEFTTDNTADYLHQEIGIPIDLPRFAEQILPERLDMSRTFEHIDQPFEDVMGFDILDPDIGLSGTERWI